MYVRGKSPSPPVQHPNPPPTGNAGPPTATAPSHDELVDMVENAQCADDLEKLLQWVSVDTLKASPYLLYTLAHKCVPFTERDSALLGCIAALCLAAVRGAPMAEAVWVRLSQQLQRNELPLPAARSLLECLLKAEEDVPQGKATDAYTQAYLHMHKREKAQRDYCLQLRRHSSAFDGTRSRARSEPAPLSHVIRRNAF